MPDNQFHDASGVPPEEFHGKLVAWDKHHARIIAAGDSYQSVKEAALAVGETDPIFEQIPAVDEGFVGSP